MDSIRYCDGVVANNLLIKTMGSKMKKQPESIIFIKISTE